MNRKNYITPRLYTNEATLFLNPQKIQMKNKKNLKKKPKFIFSLFIVIAVFSFIVAYSANAAAEVYYHADENEGWEIVNYTDETVVLTKEGEFTRGDKLFFVTWPYEGECNWADVGFFVYSEKEVEDHNYLEDKNFLIKIGNQVGHEYLNTYVIASHEFLDGFRSYFSIESYSINGLLRGFGKHDNVMIQLIDSDDSIDQIIKEVGLENPDDVSVDDFFDIQKNLWNMQGFEEYLMKTISICKAKQLDADAIS